MESDSILLSVKQMLGIDPGYCDFDLDVIASINMAIANLYQIGYEPATGFAVCNEEDTWEELSQGDDNTLSLVKTFIYAKVRMLFDPPTSSFVLTSLENQMKEMEWRIYAESEGGF